MSTECLSSNDEVDVAANIEKIRSNIEAYSKGRKEEVKLLAVSKTKPMCMITEAYEKCGQRHFGENYVQELMEKAKEMPKDIKWHMIGHLQRNKVTPLMKAVPHLYAVESVDSIKLADKLNSAAATARQEGLRTDPLNVFIEVMTSDEITKTGIAGDEEIDNLAEHIVEKCSDLKLLGLMTVANPDLTIARRCFERLAAIKDRVGGAPSPFGEIAMSSQLEINLSLSYKLELSMGMTHDMEIAIECGSTEVRVGSAIFGARNYNKKSSE